MYIPPSIHPSIDTYPAKQKMSVVPETTITCPADFNLFQEKKKWKVYWSLLVLVAEVIICSTSKIITTTSTSSNTKFVAGKYVLTWDGLQHRSLPVFLEPLAAELRRKRHNHKMGKKFKKYIYYSSRTNNNINHTSMATLKDMIHEELSNVDCIQSILIQPNLGTYLAT